MTFSKLIARWSEECAASHPEIDPWGSTWRKADRWDREHANLNEILEREFDRDRLREAYELSQAKNYAAAFQISLDLAERGSVWSMIEVGRCYEYGTGISSDLAEAENWYRRAFAGGSQIAMLKCAKAAALRKDYAACEAILQVGMDQDWTPAIFWLAWYRHQQSRTEQTYRDIFPMLKTAARRGHPAARAILANFMVRGKFGLPKVPIGFFRTVQMAVADARSREAEKA